MAEGGYENNTPILELEALKLEEEETLGCQDPRLMVDKDKLLSYLESNGPLLGLKTYIDESLFIWQNEKIHIAFVGETGVGKSSLVNALRNIPDYHEDAAKVDVNTVQQEKLKPYTFPNNDRVFLWDLPGVGLKYEPVTDIFRSLQVEKFEIVVIVLSTRFKDINLEFAKECIKLGCFVILVRTKIDQDVANDAKTRNRHDNEKECLDRIRDAIHKSIKLFQTTHEPDQNTLTNVDIFLVSSHITDAYDFKKLSSTIKMLVSQRAKRIRKQLERIVLARIEEERVMNDERFLRRKLFAAVYGFIPFVPPQLETCLGSQSIEIMLEKSKSKFGLNDRELEDFLCDVEGHIDDFEMTYSHKNDGSILRLKLEKAQNRFLKYAKLIPLVGSVISANKEVKITCMALSSISETLANDLRYVVRMRLDNLEQDLTSSLPFCELSLGSDSADN